MEIIRVNLPNKADCVCEDCVDSLKIKCGDFISIRSGETKVVYPKIQFSYSNLYTGVIFSDDKLLFDNFVEVKQCFVNPDTPVKILLHNFGSNIVFLYPETIIARLRFFNNERICSKTNSKHSCGLGMSGKDSSLNINRSDELKQADLAQSSQAVVPSSSQMDQACFNEEEVLDNSSLEFILNDLGISNCDWSDTGEENLQEMTTPVMQECTLDNSKPIKGCAEVSEELAENVFTHTSEQVDSAFADFNGDGVSNSIVNGEQHRSSSFHLNSQDDSFDFASLDDFLAYYDTCQKDLQAISEGLNTVDDYDPITP